jgi:WD40 repeat protein
MKWPFLIGCGALLAAGPVLSAREPKPFATFPTKATVAALAFTPDGKTLAVATYKYYPPTLCDWVLGFLGGSFLGPKGYYDGTIRLWDVATRKERASLKLPGGAYSLAFSAGGKRLAIGGKEEVLLAEYRAGTLRRRATLDWLRPYEPYQSIGRVIFSPDGEKLAAVKGHAIRVWDTATGKKLATFKGHTGSYISSMAFSPDGKTLAYASLLSGNKKELKDKLGELKLWDVAAGREKSSPGKQPFGAFHLRFTPNGKALTFFGVVVETRAGKEVLSVDERRWDTTTGKIRITRKKWLTLKQADLGITFALTADGKTLVIGQLDGALTLWDVDKGKRLARFKGHKGLVYSVAFSPDGKTLASGSEKVHLWDVAKLLDRKPHR